MPHTSMALDTLRTNPPREILYHDHCSWLLQRFPSVSGPVVHEVIMLIW